MVSEPDLESGTQLASEPDLENDGLVASGDELKDDSVLAYRPLTKLLHLHGVLERARISSGNQLRDVPKDSSVYEVYGNIAQRFEKMEEDIEAAMAEMVKTHPAWYWLKTVKGIGPQTSALMLGLLLPPLPDKGPSSWYKAAGLYVVQREDGESRLPRRTKGEKNTWHPGLRRNLYVVGTSLMRANGFYKGFYNDVRAALELKHPDWKGRVHSVAFWKMVKLFLSHLWEVWCDAEGIVRREAYPMEMLGHAKIQVPWEADRE